MELHQSQGLDFLQLGHWYYPIFFSNHSSYINLRELEEKSGKIFGSSDLISVDDNVASCLLPDIELDYCDWKYPVQHSNVEANHRGCENVESENGSYNSRG